MYVTPLYYGTQPNTPLVYATPFASSSCPPKCSPVFFFFYLFVFFLMFFLLMGFFLGVFLRLSSLDSEPDIRIAQRVVRKTNQPSGYLYQNEGGLEGGHFMACSVAD